MKRAVLLFVLLTAIMTWPQGRHLGTQATPHQDVHFNMWRLRWFAHALTTPSAHLFDANIFYPESRTFALSDAMLVEGAAAAPLLWAGVRPVLVHNLLLLGAIALSGAAMFALARYLTGSRGAAIVAGIIFAFAPYRFEHIMHMEMQWTMWMPLAFLALHRTLDTGRWQYGVATGGCIALQTLSSIYYGIFLATLVGLAALLLILSDRRAPLLQVAKALGPGVAIAAIVCAAYARPYVQVRARVGDRPVGEVSDFSARPSSYLAATPTNWLYGRSARRSAPERRLFPGTVAVLLAIAGLLLVAPSRRTIVYVLLLVAAFEISLGFNGYTYPFLYDHVSAYRGLRALARLGVFVLMFVGVLAACGYQILLAGRRRAVRAIALAITTLALLAEYRVTISLTDFPNTPPPVYRLLAQQPRGVVAEFPFPRADALPGDEAEHAYMSTFHWFPLLNGYSGIYPPSYLRRLERMRDFPGDASLRELREAGAKYVVVHERSYSADALGQITARLSSDGMVELGTFYDGAGGAILYTVR
jgi:hypothetical protein